MGMGMGMGAAREGYTTLFHDWHLYRSRRDNEVPSGAVGLVTITDCMGKHLHSEHVGGYGCNHLRSRKTVYDWARQQYGRGNYFIFYNAIGEAALQ